MEKMQSLIQKYNVPGPRYTSYPTVPHWNQEMFSQEQWKKDCKIQFEQTNKTEGISLYIHLPYCESMCTFCGCHKRITKNHQVELPYIHTLLKEWQLYLDLFESKPIIKELHLGGGTPTFFSAQNLSFLIEGIFKNAQLHPRCEMSFEGHPNNTTKQHLQRLYDLGFRRVSFGIQDYDPAVQKKIHRIQSFHSVAKVSIWAKEIGYTSISHDIVYGLPGQRLESIRDTIEKTMCLEPDRLAFYSYAHVPWIKGNGQRGFSEEDIPSGDEKRELYETGKQMLCDHGYVEIGMDHFALPEDELYHSAISGSVHRNFMGYTTGKTSLMIGLGASSISDSWTAFAQNEKSIETYSELVHQGIIPVVKGHHLTKEDLIIRSIILHLMCRLEADISDLIQADLYDERLHQELEIFKADGLITREKEVIKITSNGRAFVRNVCMAFDMHLKRSQPNQQLFSMTI